MKRKLIFVFGMFFLVGLLASCSSKNDKVLDQYEKIVKKVETTDSFFKQQIYAEQAISILRDLNVASLTDEQQDRLSELKARYTSACLSSGANVVKGFFSTLSNATRSFSKMNDNCDDIDEAESTADALDAISEGISAILGDTDSNE